MRVNSALNVENQDHNNKILRGLATEDFVFKREVGIGLIRCPSMKKKFV